MPELLMLYRQIWDKRSVIIPVLLCKKANVYYSAEANLKVEPLMLNLPLTSDYSGSVSDGIIGQIKYKAYKGY